MKGQLVAKVRVTDGTGVLVDRTFGSRDSLAEVARAAVVSALEVAPKRGTVSIEIRVVREAVPEEPVT